MSMYNQSWGVTQSEQYTNRVFPSFLVLKYWQVGCISFRFVHFLIICNFLHGFSPLWVKFTLMWKALAQASKAALQTQSCQTAGENFLALKQNFYFICSPVKYNLLLYSLRSTHSDSLVIFTLSVLPENTICVDDNMERYNLLKVGRIVMMIV